MKNLCDLILKNENWLNNRVIHFAKARGYIQYSSTLKESWRMSIANLSETIIKALRNYDRALELSPDDDYTRDPISAYGIKQALKHRECGFNLGVFFGLFKYYRQSYLELVKMSGFEPELSDFYHLFITRIFDRMEIGICLAWAHENEQKDYIGSLQANNRQISIEKDTSIVQ